jgi:formylglycine-generating enzyme required for sulfatase activity
MTRFLLALVLAAAVPSGVLLAEDQPPAPPGPDTPITTMIAVPAGEFTMGWPGREDTPPRRVRVSAFLLDEHEVTNAQYRAFCEATGQKPPVFWGVDEFRCGEAWPDHPVVGVSRGAAMKYAAWVGKRLPTEAEWEYAARAGTAQRYAVADTMSTTLGNYKKSEHGAPVAVKSYPPNPFGLHDLIGNVREWVIDYYGGEIPAAALVPDDGAGPLGEVTALVDPVNETKHRLGVVKGGGWFSGGGCNAAVERNGYPTGWGDFNVGFRCARDLD